MSAAVQSAVFDNPLVCRLDGDARAQLVAAARLVELAPGAGIYGEGDDSDRLFLVESGAIALSAVRRGDEAASLLRVARTGDSFGEEALLVGLRRRATASAAEPARIIEIPIAVFRRVTGRSGGEAALDREWRYLERAAARDLLAASALGRGLDTGDSEILLDGMSLERFERGARLYEAGDRAERCYILVDGLVQIQREERGRTSVVAYLGRGDLFGDEEALARAPRAADAVAAGDSWCAVLPADILRTLGDRNPGLVPRLRRLAAEQRAQQGELVAAASARSTQHVFRDLYRMQMARSLLVIDQDSCVRCGHCAWSCAEVHGVSRLVRRGDKVVTRQGGAAGAASLLLPNTCQHCRHAACMIDCPTGAIGRDPEGEVFIRPELCTGCGNCAKACPWDNIQMAPRADAAADVAVKCDLCRGYEAPACVEACPTAALTRLDPGRDIAEVAHILGAQAAAAPRIRSAAPAWLSAAATLAILIAAIGWAQHRSGAWSPGHGPGLAAGLLAGLLLVGLAAYAAPKRLVRRWMRRRPRPLPGVAPAHRPAPRSRMKPQLVLHLALGLLAPALAIAHGARLSSSPGGALAAAFLLSALVGAAGAIAYRALPRRLTRLERRGALPEDLAGEREALMSRLHRELTGTSELTKAIAHRILMPYARAPLGWLALAASGRSLADEERRLRRRLEVALAGRAQGRLDEADPLLRTAVELRALPARRALTALLRAWLPLHIVTAALVGALLLAHVVTALLS